MKRLIPIAALMAVIAGCASPQMKSTPFYSGSERVYTGKPEDRVNLWPIGYYREPALSVLWPIFSLTDDHLAIRPLYSQYRQGGKDSPYDEFNFAWPLCQFDTKRDEHRIFPLFWGDGHVDLFPLVWWRFDRSFTLFPLAWWKKDRYFNVFPLWWSDSNHKLLIPFYFQDENSLMILPFYGKTSHVDSFTEWYGPYGRHRDEKSPEMNYDWCFPFYYRDATSFESPLFGWDRNDRSSWAFPLYYKDHEGFFSLPWMSGQDKDSSWWIVPPLLSWGSRGDAGWSQRYLLGLAGVEREKDGGYADWVAPLYYRNEGSFFSLPYCEIAGACVIPPLLTILDGNCLGNPFFGWTSSCSWAFPLWYKDSTSLLTLPYCSWWKANGEWDGSFVLPALTFFGSNGDFASLLWGKAGKESWLAPLWWKDERKFVSALWCWDWGDNCDTYVVPPLLSWMEESERGSKKMRFLLGLGGVDTEEDGDVDCSWVFPLYYNDERNFISLPFAHVKNDFTYVTPLFGVTHKEHKKGAWLWPLFGWTNDDRMEAVEAMLNAPTLDPRVKLEKHESDYCSGKKHQWQTIEGVDNYVSDSSWRLSGLSTSNRTISWFVSDDGQTVTGEETSDFGNFFAYKSDSNRTVKFDYATKKKISDEETGEAGLFCNFLWHSKHEACKDHEYDMKSILWRFWHYEKLNGDVTVDSFPFFTYDSKTNGYSKTSLLWRLFRNEYDPKTDKRSVDFLFVPVWR